MSFCSHCGSAMNDGDQFCQVCGQPAGIQQQPSYPAPGQTPYNPGQTPYNPDQTPYNPGQTPYNPGQTPYNPGQYNGSYVYRPEKQIPMNWFKFLIYFALFAGAFLNVVHGIMMLTGSAYGNDVDRVYALMPSLKTVDILVGVVSLAVAALQVYTRFQLSGFKRNAPIFLMVTYLVGAAVNLVYILAAGAIINDFANRVGTASFTPDASDISTIVTSLVICVLNYVYFKKRAHLFVN